MKIKRKNGIKVLKYNQPYFIESDPISIPHRYTKKEDIEIAGFLAATIAWGKREMILKNAFLNQMNKLYAYFTCSIFVKGRSFYSQIQF